MRALTWLQPQRAPLVSRQWPDGPARMNTMDAQQQEEAQAAWVNELLHRMTVADTKAVRVQLCAETKQAIAELLDSRAGSKQ